jgi:hypothetical protein
MKNQIYIIPNKKNNTYAYRGYILRIGYHEFHDFEETKFYIK